MAYLRDSRRDTKSLWNNIATITHLKKVKSCTSKLLNVKHTCNESSDFVNTYFSEIGKNLADAINNSGDTRPMAFSTSPPNLSSFVLYDTDSIEVREVLRNLKKHSAPGPDNIPTEFLKLAETEVVPILTHLVNICFSNGVFPSLLKESLVTPVHKGGSEDDVSNYRPISVLSVISKILEKLINKRLLSYLNKFNILSNTQFGFRSGKSTEDAVSALTSVVAEGLDNKKKCLAVFLDLKKAFDTVSIPILEQKLEHIGVRGVPLNLFKSYLNGRSQRVKLDQAISKVASINFGVPQGSVLGPTLFLVYINDLCDMKLPHTSIFSYADDTAIVFTGDSWSNVKKQAEQGLTVIAKWLNGNLLTLNTSKTNFMCFSIYDRYQPESSYEIKIHQCNSTLNFDCTCPTIKKVSTTKYLGVILDQRLNWHHQID